MPKPQTTSDRAKQLHLRVRPSSSYRLGALVGSTKSKSKLKLKSKSKSKPKRTMTMTKTVTVAFRSSACRGKTLSKLRTRTKAKKRLQQSSGAMPPKRRLRKKTKKATAAKNYMMPKKETNKKKPTRGTPVLFLVKDPGCRLQAVSCPTAHAKGKRGKKPLQPSKVPQYTVGRKQMPSKMMPRYVATASIPTNSMLARQGVDFFHHLGQRKAQATDSKENDWKPSMRLSGGGWNSGASVNLDANLDAEVPLTHRLPIIDFISTNEFERMCTKSRLTGASSICSTQQRM